MDQGFLYLVLAVFLYFIFVHPQSPLWEESHLSFYPIYFCIFWQAGSAYLNLLGDFGDFAWAMGAVTKPFRLTETQDLPDGPSAGWKQLAWNHILTVSTESVRYRQLT